MPLNGDLSTDTHDDFKWEGTSINGLNNTSGNPSEVLGTTSGPHQFGQQVAFRPPESSNTVRRPPQPESHADIIDLTFEEEPASDTLNALKRPHPSLSRSDSLKLRDLPAQPSYKRPRGRPRVYPRSPTPEGKLPRGRPRIYPRSPTPEGKQPRGRPKKRLQPENDNTLETSSPKRSWRVQTEINLDKSYMWMIKHHTHPLVKQLMLQRPAITIVNDVDEQEPTKDFTLIKEYHFTNGTTRLDPNARYGCDCQKSKSSKRSCETNECLCLADCATDEHGNPLGFPYVITGAHHGCLRTKYLDHRHVIYECNELCSCGVTCKNTVVGKGRKVPLEIFKTKERGWGLRCLEDLRRGQFLDVYLGEVITDEEAKKREEISSINKNSYLFALDKFWKEPTGSSKFMYVVDGEKQGSVARFINHCCDPNLRVFAVSQDRGDPRVYQLAFFAAEDISAGTELTFDYLDQDGEDHDGDRKDPGYIDGREKEAGGMARCACSAPNCRGWLWI